MNITISKNWKRKLLTIENAKTKKGESLGYLTGILYLAPSVESERFGGRNMCPNASKGCAASCLFNSGRGKFLNIRKARIAKTLYYLNNRNDFLKDLETSIEALIRRAKRNNMKVAVRLQGTSDEYDERWGIMEKFPDVQFYGYTKIPRRIWKYARGEMPKNYHLTFSRSEENQNDVNDIIINTNVNIAVVFKDGIFPDTYLGRRVVDGTEHDLTFIQPRGVCIGLKPSGKAKLDTSGFVVSF